MGLTDESFSADMRRHFAKFGARDIELRLFSTTQAQLENIASEATELLRDGRAPSARPMVEVGLATIGEITVRVADGDLNDTDAGFVAAARALPTLFSVADVDQIPVSPEEACDFTGNIECDPPLRGSIWITSAVGVCSAGFNAVSRTDFKPYVITAGHCDVGNCTWRTDFADESGHDIGPFHRSRNDLETDVGILRVNNPTGWQFGWPFVTVDPTGGEAAQQYYVIDHVLYPGLGDRVCATLGNSARTDCGEVTDNYVTGGGTDGLFEVDDLCTGGGDSGSPYFSFHVAYGIHSSGDGVNGTSGCLFGRAEHATEAELRMNVAILTRP